MSFEGLHRVGCLLSITSKLSVFIDDTPPLVDQKEPYDKVAIRLEMVRWLATGTASQYHARFGMFREIFPDLRIKDIFFKKEKYHKNVGKF